MSFCEKYILLFVLSIKYLYIIMTFTFFEGNICHCVMPKA